MSRYGDRETHEQHGNADVDDSVKMPRWIAETLANGGTVDQTVLALVQQIRNCAKASCDLGFAELSSLLGKKERTISVKVSLSAEECRPEYSHLFTGVGLIRGEYLLRKHMMWITLPEMRQKIRDYVEDVLRKFTGKDVWYRTIEVPTSWVNVFDGCDHRLHEIDTVIGMRGIRRSLAFPQAFLLELEILANLSRTYNNLHVVFPFVHDVSELRAAKIYLKQLDFRGKVGIMAEIPSTILCLEKFLDEGLGCVVVGLNDLTALTLGSLREMSIYDNTHPAVVEMMAMAIEKTRGSAVEMVVAGRHNPQSIRNSEMLGYDACTVFIPDLSVALK